MNFEWDPGKNALNIEKHGFSFDAASKVFIDPFRLELDSSKPEHNEERLKAIGVVEPGVVIAVIFTDRDDRRRIISRKRARRNERKRYDQGTAS